LKFVELSEFFFYCEVMFVVFIKLSQKLKQFKHQ